MEYINRTRDEIRGDVTDDFNETQETGVGLESRNDYETYESGVRIAEKYKQSMERSLSNIASPELKQEVQAKRDKLIAELNQNKDNLSGRKLFIDAKPFIDQVSKMIDEVEDDALMLLEQTKQENELHQKIESGSQEKSYIALGEDGVMNFTASANRPSIDQVLDGVMQEGQVWLIDYTHCTNPRIKERMESVIGGSACYLTQGKDEQGNTIYTLQQKNGNDQTNINQRVLIREGVSLRSPQAIQRMGKKKQEELFAQKIKTIKTDTIEVKKGMDMLKPGSGLHTALRSSPNEAIRQEFFQKTDARLGELVIMAKKNGRELATESVSKLRTSSDMMELHFITGTEENNINFLRKGKDEITDECWSIVSQNQTDYMNFLKQRLAEKWNDASFLTQTEDIFANHTGSKKEGVEKAPEIMIESDRLAKVGYGLSIMRDIIHNVRQDEGDTRGDGDTRLTGLLQYVSNAIVAVEKQSVSESQLQKIINNVYKGMLLFKKDTITKSHIEDLLSGKRTSKKEVHVAARTFGDSLTVLGNTYTSFLAQHEAKEEGFEIVGNEHFNELYKNIEKKLNVDDEKNDALLQSLHDASNETGENSIESILRSANILPALGVIDEGKVQDLCKKIKQNIDAMKQNIENSFPTIDTMWESMEMEHAKLMVKSPKTPDDIARLQQHEMMMGNENIRNSVLEASVDVVRNTMKLEAIRGAVEGPATILLAKEAGATNSELFDDIHGIGGRFERSDENVMMLGEGVKAIAEEVAFTVVATALMPTGAGVAMMATRATKWAAKLGKGRRLMKIGSLTKRISSSRKIQKITDYMRKTKSFITHSKVAKTGAGRFVGRHADSVVSGVRNSLKQGVKHTVLTTSPDQWFEKNMGQDMVSVFKNIGMYAIIGAVGKSVQTGRISKLFSHESGLFNPKNIKVGEFMATESLVASANIGIDAVFKNEPMSAKDIAVGVAFAAVFEGLGSVKLPGKKTKEKIKSMVLGSKTITINGQVFSHKKIADIVLLNSKTTRDTIKKNLANINGRLSRYDTGLVNKITHSLKQLKGLQKGGLEEERIRKWLSSHNPLLVSLCAERVSVLGSMGLDGDVT